MNWIYLGNFFVAAIWERIFDLTPSARGMIFVFFSTFFGRTNSLRTQSSFFSSSSSANFLSTSATYRAQVNDIRIFILLLPWNTWRRIISQNPSISSRTIFLPVWFSNWSMREAYWLNLSFRSCCVCLMTVRTFPVSTAGTLSSNSLSQIRHMSVRRKSSTSSLSRNRRTSSEEPNTDLKTK